MMKPLNKTLPQHIGLPHPLDGKSLGQLLRCCTLVTGATTLFSFSQAQAQSRSLSEKNILQVAQKDKQEVDDNVNPFDDGESSHPSVPSSSKTKNSGVSEVEDSSFLDTNHFQEMGASSGEIDASQESLPELDDGFGPEKHGKTHRLKHDWGEKDIEKAFKPKQKVKNEKSATKLKVKDDIDHKRRESQQKLTAHEKSLRERSERQRIKLEETQYKDTALSASENGSVPNPSLREGLNSKPHDPSDHRLDAPFQHQALASVSAPVGGEEDPARTLLAPQGTSDSRKTSRDPKSREARQRAHDGGSELVSEAAPGGSDASFSQSDRRTRKKSMGSGFNSEDFDQVPHVAAGQDAYDLSSKQNNTYEPTLYAEDQALSLLKGSPVVKSKGPGKSTWVSSSEEENDDATHPFEGRGGQDSYDLDSGLFGDPFVQGAVGKTDGDGDGEIGGGILDEGTHLALGEDTATYSTGVDEKAVKTPSQRQAPWKIAATQGTSRHVRLLSQGDAQTSLSLRSSPVPSTFQDQETLTGEDGMRGEGETPLASGNQKKSGKSSRPGDPLSPAALTSGSELVSFTGAKTAGAALKGQKILKSLATPPPAFTLSLEVRQNHLSLSQMGMKYQVMQDSLLKNAVSKGSLKYGILGYPLGDLGISSPIARGTKEQNGFFGFSTKGGSSGEFGFSRSLAGGLMIGVMALLGLGWTGGRLLLQRSRRKQTSLGHQRGMRSPGRP